jgi:hypothetical protein
VAEGEPGTPVICWDAAGPPASTAPISSPTIIAGNVRFIMAVLSSL